MNNEEFEFTLFDRDVKLNELSKQYADLLSKSCIAFSGGLDSCVVSKLIDIVFPNNNIPRIYKDTGIEYPQIRKFVKTMALKDKRFIYLPPSKNIQKTLEKVGYPFKSKQHGHNFQIYKNNIEKCEEAKAKIISSGIIERIKNDTYTDDDVKMIKSLPKGTKTFIKYYFGIREKEIKESPTKNTEERVKREREHYLLL